MTRTITVPRPSVGRIVHYNGPIREHSDDGTLHETPGPCRAALITEVPDRYDHTHTVGLAVTLPTGTRYLPLASGGVPRSNHPDAEHWHWPERDGGVYRPGAGFGSLDSNGFVEGH